MFKYSKALDEKQKELSDLRMKCGFLETVFVKILITEINLSKRQKKNGSQMLLIMHPNTRI